ncbi:PREDICTED: pyrimidodiazepine synthase-like [Vollenhovia emeryi]|uniref:pyrimidodiazepine synthase-like n=1 Tax=Vollenhovia emeryi TaxID=411798 RepID=UPI0005F4BFA3|nr:PREDICTED: pyrimidodiazepine synthase-like [Vollenhovia emeryi]XP_011871092.1 PREDICTED: pyrimidodiazepine synthase-like [Vollenhovia emeryi]
MGSRMYPKHLSTGSVPPPLVPGKIRLYSMRFCPFAQRIHLVLDAKQIPYDVVNVNLTHKPEWLIEKSPLNKVPCIELENGETLYESLIIADYLDDAYPQNKLYPSNPLMKAKDKLLIDRFNTVISTMYFKGFSSEAPLQQDDFNEILIGLELFERELAKRATPFLGGSKPGMLDLMIWPWCERADVLKILKGEQFAIPRDRFLRLLKWRMAMKEDNAICGSFLDAQVHADFLRSRLAGAPQYDIIANS